MTKMSDHQDMVELTYDSENGLALDLYRSADAATDPLVLYVHGGGFARGDKRDDVERLISLRGHGLNVASINYRLAPSAHFPDPVDDVRHAAAFLRAEAGRLGIDARAIGVIGVSAGGYLASMATIDPGPNSAGAVQAASTWFASSDLVASTRRSPLEARISPVVFEANLLGGEVDSDLLEHASPARRDLREAPPFLILHGDSDQVVPSMQAETLHHQLSLHGRDTTLMRIAGAGHEDPVFDSGAVPAMVAAWMRAKLRAPGPKSQEGMA
jgi:acetyl esterase/lipase